MKSASIKKVMHIKRANREVIVNINMFLLGQENLKGLFWNVANIDFNPTTKALKIGITTNDTKLGTTLEKLRKNSKPLSDYLYQSGALHCRARIYFSIYKQEEDIMRVIEMLEPIKE
jgi:hypothetical protein